MTVSIRGYNERERIKELTRHAEAVRQAQEAEAKATEARRQEELTRQRVEGIYSGTTGQLGDLIQVTISGGQMLVSGYHQNFQPIAFKIANGETRVIDVIALSSSKYATPDHAKLLIRYQDGMLLIDGHDSTWDHAARLLYDPSWRHGSSSLVNTKSKLNLKNVRVGVNVIPHLRR